MKFLNKVWIWVFPFVFSVFSLSYAGFVESVSLEQTSSSPGKTTIVGREKKRLPIRVEFYVQKENRLLHRETYDSGTFSYTTPSGAFDEGGRLMIKVLTTTGQVILMDDYEVPPKQNPQVVAEEKRRQEEARRQAEQAEQEAQRQQEARRKAELDAKARRQAEARFQAEQEAQRQQEARRQAELDANRQVNARRLAEQEASRQEQARRQAELEANRQAEARFQAEQEAQRQAEARALAEEEARRQEAARLQAEAKLQAERAARRQAENMRVEEYAKEQAQIVSSHVIATFASLESYRRNFTKGFWLTLAPFVTQNSVEKMAEYKIGKKAGYQEGIQSGRMMGEQEGIRQGHEQGQKEAINRVNAVFNQGKIPDRTFPTIQEEKQWKISLSPENRLVNKDLFNEFNQKFLDDVKNLSWKVNSFTITMQKFPWNLYQVYQYGSATGYTLQNQWSNAEFALEQWRNNELGGGYRYDLYQQIDEEQKNLFRDVFLAQYQSLTLNRYQEVVKQNNETALELGMKYGRWVLPKVAQAMGEEQGFTQGHGIGAQQVYFKQYQQQYRASLLKTLDEIQNKSDLQITPGWTAQIVNAQGTNTLEIGEPVKVQFQGLTLNNFGGQPVTIDIHLSGKGLNESPIVHLAIPGFSSVTPQISNLPAMGTISTFPIEGDTQFMLVVGDQSKILSIHTAFEDTLRRFAKGNEQDSLKQQILEKIKNECLQCVMSSPACYRNENTALKRFIDWQSSSEPAKSAAKLLKEDLRSISSICLPKGPWYKRDKNKRIRNDFEGLTSQIR